MVHFLLCVLPLVATLWWQIRNRVMMEVLQGAVRMTVLVKSLDGVAPIRHALCLFAPKFVVMEFLLQEKSAMMATMSKEMHARLFVRLKSHCQLQEF